MWHRITKCSQLEGMNIPINCLNGMRKPASPPIEIARDGKHDSGTLPDISASAYSRLEVSKDPHQSRSVSLLLVRKKAKDLLTPRRMTRPGPLQPR